VTRWKDGRHIQAATGLSIFVSADPPGAAVSDTADVDAICHHIGGGGSESEQRLTLQPLHTTDITD